MYNVHAYGVKLYSLNNNKNSASLYMYPTIPTAWGYILLQLIVYIYLCNVIEAYM